MKASLLGTVVRLEGGMCCIPLVADFSDDIFNEDVL